VNPRVSRDLGTRHRAALGLTEENDAVAIVVSEETGTISLAIGGDFERDFDAEQLRSRLAALLGYGRRGVRRVTEARSSLA
jgi:diadenylate cyclase